MQFESSFLMEGYTEREDGTRSEITVRVDGNDSHWTLESDDGTGEIYSVDGTKYLVSEESCLRDPETSQTQGMTGAQFEEDRSAGADVTPSGTDTIDGEDVLVYEISSGEEVTYYVSTDTGYPVRVETGNGAFDFSSWGDVEPIGTPDMECQEY
jgi:hypothetical protein